MVEKEEAYRRNIPTAIIPITLRASRRSSDRRGVPCGVAAMAAAVTSAVMAAAGMAAAVTSAAMAAAGVAAAGTSAAMAAAGVGVAVAVTSDVMAADVMAGRSAGVRGVAADVTAAGRSVIHGARPEGTKEVLDHAAVVVRAARAVAMTAALTMCRQIWTGLSVSIGSSRWRRCCVTFRPLWHARSWDTPRSSSAAMFATPAVWSRPASVGCRNNLELEGHGKAAGALVRARPRVILPRRTQRMPSWRFQAMTPHSEDRRCLGHSLDT